MKLNIEADVNEYLKMNLKSKIDIWHFGTY